MKERRISLTIGKAAKSLGHVGKNERTTNMFRFQVTGMSCNHCVGAITDAIREADAKAVVVVDLKAGRVTVDNSSLPATKIAAVIADAGFTAETA